jgi:hypothetical protein
VTDAAILTKVPLMLIILLMTGETGRIRALENIVDMTIRAFHIGMFAFQFESREIVIKDGRLPTRSRVTDAAVLSKLSVMLIIFLVAGKTGAIRALEDVVKVAIGTLHIQMLALQFEGRKVMIEGGRFPTADTVTGAAILAQPGFVRIIFAVAIKTLDRRGFKICRAARIGMAVRAGRSKVFAFQLESRQIVVIFFADAFPAIMTGHALAAIGLHVGHHKCFIQLLVAGAALGPVKGGDIRAMTIGTHKNLAVAALLV